jgi:hypothetical protein
MTRPALLTILVLLISAGCGSGDAPEAVAPEAPTVPSAVAHLQACVDDAPDEPCPPNPDADAAYWTAQQEAQSESYLDAAELCLLAALESQKAGREGACVDVHEAYVAEGVRSDLGGRLDESEARRGYAKARIALQRQRSQTFIDGMRAEPGRDVPQSIE